MLSFLGAHWIALASTLGIGGGLSAASIFIPGFNAIFSGIVQVCVQWLSRRSLGEIVALALGVALLIDHLALLESHRHSAKVEAQLVKCSDARHADQIAYAKAQADAQAKNAATVAADKAARERITHDVSQSYEAELASLRADLARRLPQGGTAAPQSDPGKPGLPGVSAAPNGPDGGSRVSIPSSLYVRGAELELQLERLQQWVAEQVKVDPNAEPAK